MRRRPHASAPRHDVQRAGPKPAERGIERGEPGREGAEHEPVPTYFALDLAPPVGELLAERRRRGAVAPLGARSRRRRALSNSSSIDRSTLSLNTSLSLSVTTIGLSRSTTCAADEDAHAAAAASARTESIRLMGHLLHL